MKLLLDENLPAALGRALTGAGFDVQLVADLTPGATDDAVLAGAVRDAQIAVTADKDLGALIYLGGHAHLGVVLIRVHPVSAHIDRIVRILSDRRADLDGAFVVVGERKVRIRRPRS